MDNKQLQNRQEVNSLDRRKDIEFIQDKFNIKNVVENLHKMMNEVTKEDFSAKNVNAACHCVQQLNETINTTIKASRFLRSGE